MKGYFSALGGMSGIDVLLEFGQNCERGLDRAFGGFMDGKPTALVDHIENIQFQIAKIAVNRSSQLCG